MAATAKKTDPKLWERIKARVTKGTKGGDAGEWSARKAQLAVQEYKKAGGGYEGRKTDDNHLLQWEKEEWGTKSGRKSGDTGERYLPKKARESLSDEEYARTTAKKRRDTAKGKQFSAQPRDVARKAATARKTGAAKRAASGKTERAPAARKVATARKSPAAREATPQKRKPVAKAAPASKTTGARTAARKPAPKRATAKKAATGVKRPATRSVATRKAPARKAPPRAAAKRATTPTKRAPARATTKGRPQ